MSILFQRGVRISIFLTLLTLYVGWFAFQIAVRDFGSFVASGQAASQHLDPYAIYPLTNFIESGDGSRIYGINLNPPFLLPLFEWVAKADVNTAFIVWTALSCALYLTAVAWLARAYPQHADDRRFWVLLLSGLWFTLGLGQLYTLLTLIGAGAWIALHRNQHSRAGLLLGLLTAIKPNFILWPIFLWLAGYRRAATIAILSFVGWSLLPIARYGPLVYQQWLAVLPTAPGLGWPINPSLFSLTERLGIPWLGLPIAVVLVAPLAFWLWRRNLPATEVSALALVAILLISPITWIGYTLLLLPILMSRPWSPLLRISIALLVVPDIIVQALDTWLPMPFASMAWIYTVALLLLLLSIARPYLPVLNNPVRTLPLRNVPTARTQEST